MTRFGDELRQEREARGLSVEDISSVTKVSAMNVRLLEAGEYADLPGGVFRKGIVRSYLGAVGLEEAPWMERFEQSCRELGVGSGGERDWVEFAENVKKNRAPRRRSMAWRWVGVVLLLAAVGAAGWFAWRYVKHRRSVLDGAVVASSAARAELLIDKRGPAFFTWV